MNEGRWVWCPPGWRVVPEVATPIQLEAMARVEGGTRGIQDQRAWRIGVASAPEPPSGWNPGYPPEGKSWVNLGLQDGEILLNYSKNRGPGCLTVPPLPPEDALGHNATPSATSGMTIVGCSQEEEDKP